MMDNAPALMPVAAPVVAKKRRQSVGKRCEREFARNAVLLTWLT